MADTYKNGEKENDAKKNQKKERKTPKMKPFVKNKDRL